MSVLGETVQVLRVAAQDSSKMGAELQGMKADLAVARAMISSRPS